MFPAVLRPNQTSSRLVLCSARSPAEGRINVLFVRKEGTTEPNLERIVSYGHVICVIFVSILHALEAFLCRACQDLTLLAQYDQHRYPSRYTLLLETLRGFTESSIFYFLALDVRSILKTLWPFYSQNLTMWLLLGDAINSPLPSSKNPCCTTFSSVCS